MIKADNYKVTQYNPYTVQAELLADTRAEVERGDSVRGLPKDTALAMGSSVFCLATGEVAFMDSQGTWHWQ